MVSCDDCCNDHGANMPLPRCRSRSLTIYIQIYAFVSVCKRMKFFVTYRYGSQQGVHRMRQRAKGTDR